MVSQTGMLKKFLCLLQAGEQCVKLAMEASLKVSEPESTTEIKVHGIRIEYQIVDQSCN